MLSKNSQTTSRMKDKEGRGARGPAAVEPPRTKPSSTAASCAVKPRLRSTSRETPRA